MTPARAVGTVRGVCAGAYAVKLPTWGGLRGGLSVALALVLREHLPGGPADLLLVMTYVVVVFSSLVQGLSMPRLVRRYVPGAAEDGGRCAREP